MKTRRLPCPRCGSHNTAQIIYGMPCLEFLPLLGRNKPYVEGGCFPAPPGEPHPTHVCWDCDHEWKEDKVI